MSKISQLIYNADIDRLELDGDSLHCGEVINVLLVDRNGKTGWYEVRLEFGSKGWFMVHSNGEKEVYLSYQVNGLFAKRFN